MNLSTIFVLVFSNMILYHCTSGYLENHFILVTHINLNILEGHWLSPFYNMNKNIEDVCEALKTRLIFKINAMGEQPIYHYFKDSEVPHYEMLLDGNHNSETVEKLHYLWVNEEFIEHAVLCIWGKSFVYIANNSQIEPGLILFIRNEYTGLKVFGLILQFLPPMAITNNNDITASFHKSLNSKKKEERWEARCAWQRIKTMPVDFLSEPHYEQAINTYYKNLQSFIWQLCASVYWNLTDQTTIEKTTKLKCSFENKQYKQILSKKIHGKLTPFLVLHIENESSYDNFNYNLILHTQCNKTLYIIENNSNTVSLCELQSDITIEHTREKNTYLDTVIYYGLRT